MKRSKVDKLKSRILEKAATKLLKVDERTRKLKEFGKNNNNGGNGLDFIKDVV